jgi:amino acid transporter
MVPRRTSLVSLLVRAGRRVQAHWSANIGMTAIVAIVAFAGSLSWQSLVRAAASVAFAVVIVLIYNLVAALRDHPDWEPDIRVVTDAILFTLVRKNQLKTPTCS